MKKQQEILDGQIGGTLTKETEELIHEEEVPGTPFKIITAEGKSWIALGRYRISCKEHTPEELKEKIYNMDYDFLINVIFAVVDMTDKMKNDMNGGGIIH